MTLTSNETLSLMKSNYTLNRKGADAWKSTTSYLLDLWSLSNIRYPKDQDEFENVCQTVIKSIKQDPGMFLSVLRFKRHVDKGNGMKWLYYLCTAIWASMISPEIYEKTLEWSIEYPRDLLTLDQINFNRQFDNVEINLYAKKLVETMVSVLKGEEYNPMYFKYLSYSTGKWKASADFIWKQTNDLINQDNSFSKLLEECEPKSSLGKKLKEVWIMHNSMKITNKLRRKIKKCFNEEVNLLDNLFHKVHKDGSVLGAHSDRQTEISMIVKQFEKSPSIAFQKFVSTIKTMENKESSKGNEVRDKLLIDSYKKYVKNVEEGKTEVKTRGLELWNEAFSFFLNSEVTVDTVLEAKLENVVSELKSSILKNVGEEVFPRLAESFEIVVDNSGSMFGTPLEISLFYALLLTKALSLKRVFYFNSSLEVYDIPMTNSLCNLIKSMYRETKGCTCLSSVFDYFQKEEICNRNVIILTDGDCDPNGGDNPFHTAPKESQNLRYVVANVNQEHMEFPYLNMDPYVCYVNGNNPKTLNGFINALMTCIKENIPLTPTMVLTETLKDDTFTHSIDVSQVNFDMPYDTEMLFMTFEMMFSTPQKDNSDDFDNPDNSDKNKSECLACGGSGVSYWSDGCYGSCFEC